MDALRDADGFVNTNYILTFNSTFGKQNSNDENLPKHRTINYLNTVTHYSNKYMCAEPHILYGRLTGALSGVDLYNSEVLLYDIDTFYTQETTDLLRIKNIGTGIENKNKVDNLIYREPFKRIENPLQFTPLATKELITHPVQDICETNGVLPNLRFKSGTYFDFTINPSTKTDYIIDNTTSKSFPIFRIIQSPATFEVFIFTDNDGASTVLTQYTPMTKTSLCQLTCWRLTYTNETFTVPLKLDAIKGYYGMNMLKDVPKILEVLKEHDWWAQTGNHVSKFDFDVGFNYSDIYQDMFNLTVNLGLPKFFDDDNKQQNAAQSLVVNYGIIAVSAAGLPYVPYVAPP
jgi:hypothetical protein